MVVVASAALVGCTSRSSLPPQTPSNPPGSMTTSNLVAPDLVGKTKAQAEQTLTSLGVVSISTTSQNDRSVKPGTVIAQVPAAGEPVSTGTGFELTIASQGGTSSSPST
jgi:beta-lactam-binding protein with PASTA domain